MTSETEAAERPSAKCGCSTRDCLKILYWTQTKAYETVKRSAEGPFMPFDGTKCPAETSSSYFLDSLSRKLAEQSCRHHTPRYLTGMRVYANEFPRTLTLGSSVNKSLL